MSFLKSGFYFVGKLLQFTAWQEPAPSHFINSILSYQSV
jgi:hypothetical protein